MIEFIKRIFNREPEPVPENVQFTLDKLDGEIDWMQFDWDDRGISQFYFSAGDLDFNVSWYHPGSLRDFDINSISVPNDKWGRMIYKRIFQLCLTERDRRLDAALKGAQHDQD